MPAVNFAIVQGIAGLIISKEETLLKSTVNAHLHIGIETKVHQLIAKVLKHERTHNGFRSSTVDNRLVPGLVLFFCLMAAWLNEVVVRAVALLSALTKEYNMHIIQC